MVSTGYLKCVKRFTLFLSLLFQFFLKMCKMGDLVKGIYSLHTDLLIENEMHVLHCPNWSISSMCLSCNSCIMHPVILGYTVYMMNKYITWSGQGVYYLCRYGWECHFMWCCYTITNQIHHERRLDLYNPMYINYRKKICIHIQTYTINCKQGLCLYSILCFVSSCKITFCHLYTLVDLKLDLQKKLLIQAMKLSRTQWP